jgi:mannose-1-phosphate guanylyltransferase
MLFIVTELQAFLEFIPKLFPHQSPIGVEGMVLINWGGFETLSKLAYFFETGCHIVTNTAECKILYTTIMIVVIIAGGSGTRLWPLSTPNYPKHLMKIDGSDASLLQTTYKRAQKLTEHIYVVSDSSHIEHVREQLSVLPPEAFIVEPARRGTANCIIAALAYISSRHEADEPIAFIHADHYIRDVAGFRYSFRLAERIAAREKRIVLVGVEPDKPATGFGYIEKGELLDEQNFVFNVNSFKEKPDYQTAKAYLKSGNYLWNGGYFLGSLATFLSRMEQFAPELADHYQQLLNAKPEDYQQVYLSFESIAIDYALIEKVPDLLVVPATFDWMDLGSFSDLSRAVNGDDKGNYLQGQQVEIEEVKNSFIQDEEAKPVIVIGLDNIVVVNTPHGLLVARKDMSQKVGDVSKRLQEKSD